MIKHNKLAHCPICGAFLSHGNNIFETWDGGNLIYLEEEAICKVHQVVGKYICREYFEKNKDRFPELPSSVTLSDSILPF